MKLPRIAAALAFAAATAVSHAAPVTFQFTATLDDSDIAGWAAGSVLSGQFSYDTDALPASEPMELEDGSRFLTYALSQPNAFQLSIGGDLITSSNLNVVIVDAVSTDAEIGDAVSFMVDGLSINGQARDGSVNLTFLSNGSNPDVLTSALPASLNLDDFEPFAGRTGLLLGINDASAGFTVTSLSATAVPEPATALTMLTGMALMGGLVSRRRRGV